MINHKIKIVVLDSKHKALIEAALPSNEVTVVTAAEMNEICLSMFVKKALAEYLEDLDGVTIYLSENQNKSHFVCENDGFSDVIQIMPSEQVDHPTEWVIEANPLALMGLLTFSSETQDDVLDEKDELIWFDVHHSAIFKESTTDFDYDSASAGSVFYDRDTGKMKIELNTECEVLEPLFEDPRTKAYFAEKLAEVFGSEGFRDEYWEYEPSRDLTGETEEATA